MSCIARLRCRDGFYGEWSLWKCSEQFGQTWLHLANITAKVIDDLIGRLRDVLGIAVECSAEALQIAIPCLVGKIGEEGIDPGDALEWKSRPINFRIQVNSVIAAACPISAAFSRCGAFAVTTQIRSLRALLAGEQLRGQNVQGLEVGPNVSELATQIRKHRARELVDQQCAVRI